MISGCGSGSNSKASDNITVHIGFFPNITHSQALVGKENKSFEKAFGNNTKVEWKQFNAGSSEIEAVLAGAVDIGYIGPGPAINGYTKSKGDVQIIAGSTDAVLVPEPWGSRLVVEANANVVLDYDKVWRDGKYPTAVVIVRKEFLKKHPDIVEKFLKTHVELTDYINKNSKEASNIINKPIYNLTKKSLSDDVLNSAFKRINTTNNPEKDALNEMVDLSVNEGFIKQKPDTKNLINLKLLNKVLKEKGEKTIQ